MLALTEEATEAIGGILANPAIPEGAGVRITTATPATNSSTATGLQVALAEAPDDSDEVIEQEGARVFVEDTVSELLQDKLLDVELSGEQVRFSIANAP